MNRWVSWDADSKVLMGMRLVMVIVSPPRREVHRHSRAWDSIGASRLIILAGPRDHGRSEAIDMFSRVGSADASQQRNLPAMRHKPPWTDPKYGSILRILKS
jgi:hypothetical protein